MWEAFIIKVQWEDPHKAQPMVNNPVQQCVSSQAAPRQGDGYLLDS